MIVFTSRIQSSTSKYALLLALFLLTTGHRSLLAAQNCPVEHSFPFPQRRVEGALRSLHAYSGQRIPTLAGFAEQSGAAFDLYKHGYFQYSLRVIPTNAGETKVRVCAKITAWLSETGAPGYKELTSNGRLENDLFDRLDEVLRPALTPKVNSADKLSTPGLQYPLTGPQLASAPQPHDLKSPFNISSHPFGVLPETKAAPIGTSPTATTTAEDQNIQRLTRQAQELEDVLRSQVYPSNLISVNHAHTAVRSAPTEEAKVLFYADAEDEFEKLNATGPWVHVQISGLSRGWIHRSNLEELEPSHGVPSAREAVDSPKFREVRGETSVFPGKWRSLDGKQVKLIWIQPSSKASVSPREKKDFATTVFRETNLSSAASGPEIAGVVIVFDAADGLMAGTTRQSLLEWQSGHLSTSEFWQQCWVDPENAFKTPK